MIWLFHPNDIQPFDADLIKLPMSYHFCTGVKVPAAYNSTLTEKCDFKNHAFEDLVSGVYFITYLVFGSLVMYENAKRKIQVTSKPIVQRSLHILVNNKLFFWRITVCVGAVQVCSLNHF